MAASLQVDFPEGAWLVELAPLGDPTFVLPAIAATLGIREESSRPLAGRLTEALRHRQLLLVLDNCEHVVAECAQLAELLLRSCPRLVILATSREALAIDGERIVDVAPLRLPDPRRDLSFEELSRSEAIGLFDDRARAVSQAFQLTPENVGAVMEICQRLDGLPLALELAAARIRTMAPAQLVSRLDQRLGLLVGGSRTAQPRHQTLRALIDWSYTLLGAGEQRLFRRLAVFAGSWTLELAEEVCGSEDLPRRAVLEIMDQLAARSLLIAEPHAGLGRSSMLETLREYAGERLAEAGEQEELRTRHLQAYRRLAEGLAPALDGPAQLKCLERLEQEHANLQAALEWSLGSSAAADLQAGLELAGALRQFWFYKNHWSEARQWLGQLLTRAQARSAEAQAGRAYARCVCAAGAFAQLHSDLPPARSSLEHGLQLCEAADDEQGVALARSDLAWNDIFQGAYDDGLRRLESSASSAQTLGDHALLALTRYRQGLGRFLQGDLERARISMEQSLRLYEQLAPASAGAAMAQFGLCVITADQGAYAVARAALERSTQLFEQLGDTNGLCMAWGARGELERVQGHHQEAAICYNEALALARTLGLVRDEAMMLHNIGHILLHQGACDLAAAQFKQSLDLYTQIGDQTRGVLLAIAGLAGVAAVRGQRAVEPQRAQHAVALFGAVKALLSSSNFAFERSDQQELDRNLALARACLDDASFASAWAAGAALSLDQAIALACAELG